MDHENHIIELFVGYSHFDKKTQECKANSSVTLIKGESKIILFDTLSAWDRDLLLRELKFHHVKPEQVDYVICSHGHADHIGNLNLFLNAIHFVGSSKSHKNVYYFHDFEKESYKVDKNIELISTPGHTSTCVSLIVRNTNLAHHSSVGVVGDLFEKEEDVFDETHWLQVGTEDEQLQRKNRLRVALMVEKIIPGHGPMFVVTAEMREKLHQDLKA